MVSRCCKSRLVRSFMACKIRLPSCNNNYNEGIEVKENENESELIEGTKCTK